MIEGSASTVHVVRNGTLLTPPLHSTRVPGTTRGVVEELADNLGIARRNVRISEPRTAQSPMKSGSLPPRAKCSRSRVWTASPVGSGRPVRSGERIYDAYQQLKKGAAQP